MRDKNKTKQKKRGQPWPISQLLPSQERKREETRKRRRLERKKYGDFVLVYLINFFFFFYESIFISFRCNFCTSVHIAYDLLLSCLLVSFFSFFLRKSWRFVLTKMEMFWFSLFIFSLFLYIFYEIIFISFRCTFSRWIHLACGLLFSFLFFFSWESFANLF